MRNIEIRENTNEVIRYPEDMYCVYFHQDPETDEVIYVGKGTLHRACLLYTSPSPRDP